MNDTKSLERPEAAHNGQPDAPITHAWPPDPVPIIRRRVKLVNAMRRDAKTVAALKVHYRENPADFISDWVDTYDPRMAGTGRLAYLPLQLFERQREMVEFLEACRLAGANGAIPKARDMGCTWVGCAYSVALFLFVPGVSVGWGSRKEALVDTIGSLDSIFEKMRMILRRLPREFWPKGFDMQKHCAFMKILNPATGATITGEAGDGIGRGSRKSIQFLDEAAHIARPENIEAALADTTDCQIDISSVNGSSNVFARKCERGKEWRVGEPVVRDRANVFPMRWDMHPAKDSVWYETRRAKAKADGLLHIFEQEVAMNWSASVEGIMIQPEWIQSAIDAHEKLDLIVSGMRSAALDVADTGGDMNALALRRGVMLEDLRSWGDRDTGQTALMAVETCRRAECRFLDYDSIGVGAGVRGEMGRLKREGLLPRVFNVMPWNAAASPLWPKRNIVPGDRESPKNIDQFANLKAQGWWELAQRFYRTHRAVTEPGFVYDPDTLIVIPSHLEELNVLVRELSQPTSGLSSALKMLVNKTPSGSKSPNLADAVMMAMWPIPRRANNIRVTGKTF